MRVNAAGDQAVKSPCGTTHSHTQPCVEEEAVCITQLKVYDSKSDSKDMFRLRLCEY